jgi:hypothetical protein
LNADRSREIHLTRLFVVVLLGDEAYSSVRVAISCRWARPAGDDHHLPGCKTYSLRSVLVLPAIFTRPRIAPFGDFHRRGLAKRPKGVSDAALTSA